MRKSNYILGLIMILLGGLILSSDFLNFYILTPMIFLPILILGIGLSFEAGYFANRKAPGLLVPGGILTTIGMLFFFEVTTNWRFAAYTWPIYILAVVIGLFQLYLFSGKPKGLLIPIFILLSVAVAFISMNILILFNSWIDLKLIISILLMGSGLIIITRKTSESNAWR